MAEQPIVNSVVSYSSGVPGRSLNNVRTHHFVIDEPEYNGGPGEEISPADSFLAGVSACGVLLVERFARESSIPLREVRVAIQGVRRPSDPSRFERLHMRFQVQGPNQTQAEGLVERYKVR